MRVTRFELDGGQVRPDIVETPAWEPLDDHDGEPLVGVEITHLQDLAHGHTQLVTIGAGGHYVMHDSPDVAFCQVVRGRGVLRLPGGSELTYEGPELYVFEPGTLHEWDDITEETLLSVCLVEA